MISNRYSEKNKESSDSNTSYVMLKYDWLLKVHFNAVQFICIQRNHNKSHVKALHIESKQHAQGDSGHLRVKNVSL